MELCHEGLPSKKTVGLWPEAELPVPRELALRQLCGDCCCLGPLASSSNRGREQQRVCACAKRKAGAVGEVVRAGLLGRASADS